MIFMKKQYLAIPLLIFISISVAPFCYGQNSNTVQIFGESIDKKKTSANGYKKCITTEYEHSLKKKNPDRLSTAEFEKWLTPKIENLKRRITTNKSILNILVIPVVVHVIHNGDEYGKNENITDEQVESQIQVLNQDFRREINTPGYNNNPVGADVEIEFCLAEIDPNGNKTNGIDRVNLNMEDLGREEIEDILKPQTSWDPDRYFNIWTCNFGKDLKKDDIIGYAQFPSGSTLPGISQNEGDSNTDGIVIRYDVFGSVDIYPQGTYINPGNKGRTVTHETGHWLGLRHIWGDKPACRGDDYCADTPAAKDPNFECVEHASCTPRDMIENYMDYTEDYCMNIFTQDQKIRMQTVMSNSIRRKSLLNSTVCNSGKYNPMKQKEITIYPNPTTSILNIYIPNTSGTIQKYIVYNYLGQMIEEVTSSNNYNLKLDVLRYSTGVYFIKIYTSNETKTLKFLKK